MKKKIPTVLKAFVLITSTIFAQSAASILTPAAPVIQGETASAGAMHRMVITVDGTLWGQGINRRGQLGDGTTINRHSPVHIMGNVIAVSSGGMHTMAITADGTLWGWGWNEDGQPGDGTATTRRSPVCIMDNVAAVSAGGLHTITISTDGTLWGRGWNEFGQPGDGTTTYRFSPVRIMDNIKLSGTVQSVTSAPLPTGQFPCKN